MKWVDNLEKLRSHTGKIPKAKARIPLTSN